MTRSVSISITACLFLALLGLSACGQNAAGGSSPEIGGHTTGTSVPVTKLTPAPTAKSSPGTKIEPGTPGPITLSLNANPSVQGIIKLTLNNQSGKMIAFADHLTDCSTVLLQRLVAATWQSVNPCRLMTPTRLHQLPTGQNQQIQVGTSSTQWQPGHYRFSLSYFGGKSQAGGTIYSKEFDIS